MAYQLTPAHEAFRADVREYVSSVLPEVGEEGISTDPQASRRFFERVGADGWFGLAWPRSLGGQERSPVDVAVFEEECYSAGAPMELYSLTSFVGNALLRLGTQKEVGGSDTTDSTIYFRKIRVGAASSICNQRYRLRLRSFVIARHFALHSAFLLRRL